MKSRFGEEKHFGNKKVTQDIHNVEDFIDDLGTSRFYSSLKQAPEDSSRPPQEGKSIDRAKKKFAKMTKRHPFDTFMDKSLVAKEEKKQMAESNFGQVAALWTHKHYGSIEELLKQKADYLKFADFQQSNKEQEADRVDGSLD